MMFLHAQIVREKNTYGELKKGLQWQYENRLNLHRLNSVFLRFMRDCRRQAPIVHRLIDAIFSKISSYIKLKFWSKGTNCSNWTVKGPQPILQSLLAHRRSST